jgi:hypothetical protein
MELKNKPVPAVELEEINILPKVSEEEFESLRADHQLERERF